jgi:hypothetical protein
MKLGSLYLYLQSEYLDLDVKWGCHDYVSILTILLYSPAFMNNISEWDQVPAEKRIFEAW